MASQLRTAPVPRCVLAFGTSTEWCSVALLVREDSGEPRCDMLEERAGHGHSRRALVMAETLLRRAGLAIGEVDAIAFDAGPGSFTGLRIGCGIAQGLGFALGRPVVPVASLEALAHAAGAPCALVAIDARMGETYCAVYRIEDGVARACGGLRVLSPDDAASWLLDGAVDRGAGGGGDAGVTGAHDAATARPLARESDGPRVLALGDGYARHPVLAAVIAARGISVLAERHPSADAIAAIGWRRLLAGEALDASRAAPIYVRDKVALDVDEQRGLRAARERSAAGASEGGTRARGAIRER